MAGTAVETINDIITEQGGTSDAKTIVEALDDLGEVIGQGGGGGIADGSVTTAKLADSAVTATKIGDFEVTTAKLENKAVTMDKLSDELYNHLVDIAFVAADATTQTALATMGYDVDVLTPAEFAVSGENDDVRTRLAWLDATNSEFEVAPVDYVVSMLGVITFYARGYRTMASGAATDTSWTIASL